MAKHYTLYQSARSPFARRIRLLFEELGLKYDLVVEDVFKPSPEFLSRNPVARVPALILETGELVSDSSQIQELLRSRHGDHPLFNRGPQSEAAVRAVSGLSVGLMEWTIANFLESTRPSGMRDSASSEEAIGRIRAVLKQLEGQVKGLYFFGDKFGVWDIDLGAALAYSDLRNGASVVDAYPRLRKYLQELEKRASFQKTQPPK